MHSRLFMMNTLKLQFLKINFQLCRTGLLSLIKAPELEESTILKSCHKVYTYTYLHAYIYK